MGFAILCVNEYCVCVFKEILMLVSLSGEMPITTLHHVMNMLNNTANAFQGYYTKVQPRYLY